MRLVLYPKVCSERFQTRMLQSNFLRIFHKLWYARYLHLFEALKCCATHQIKHSSCTRSRTCFAMSNFGKPSTLKHFVCLCKILSKKNQNNTFSSFNVLKISNKIPQLLHLKKNKAITIPLSSKSFDVSHSYSCALPGSKISFLRLEYNFGLEIALIFLKRMDVRCQIVKNARQASPNWV